MKRVSILWMLIIMMLIVSLAGVLPYQAAYGSLTSVTFGQLDLRILMQGVEQAKTRLDTLLETLENYTSFMASAVLLRENNTSETVAGQMGSLLQLEPDIGSVLLLDREGRIVAGEPRNQLKGSYDASGEEWFQRAAAVGEGTYSTPHIQMARRSGYVWVVTRLEPVQFVLDGQEREGYLAVDIRVEALQRICEAASLAEEGYIYIHDGAGNDIYNPRAKLNNLKHVSALYRDIGEQDARYRLLEVSQPCLNGSWFMTGMVRESEVHQSSSSIRSQSFTVLFACIILSFVLAGVSSLIIVRPIVSMEHTMKRLAGTTQDMRLVPTGPKEIVSLSHQYNAMLDKIDQLLLDANERQAQLRDMELTTLQDQINPHFLYNTLDSIVWILEAERSKEAIGMIEALAKLLRLSINRGGHFHTVASEIEHIENYLIIQRARLGQRFRVDIQMEEEARELMCPKIILQPIVENAIKYGIGEASRCTITLRVWRNRDSLRISVHDDGMGIQGDKLRELQRNMRSAQAPDERRRGGVGMRNVNRRIRLLCGDAYGLSIDSEQEEWTCVTYALPLLPNA